MHILEYVDEQIRISVRHWASLILLQSSIQWPAFQAQLSDEIGNEVREIQRLKIEREKVVEEFMQYAEFKDDEWEKKRAKDTWRDMMPAWILMGIEY